MKLYMVVLGGNCGNSNIEVHDVRFVVGETIEQCIPRLREEWYGNPEGLHMDSYTQLDEVDGYSLELVKEPVEQAEELFFVNLGAYIPGHCLEQHNVDLLVDQSPSSAKKRALASSALEGMDERHKDDLHAVDDILNLKAVGGYHLKLTPLANKKPLSPTWYGYRPIDL